MIHQGKKLLGIKKDNATTLQVFIMDKYKETYLFNMLATGFKIHGLQSINSLRTCRFFCTPTISVTDMMLYLKGKSSRKLQEKFPELKKKYWGQHLWATWYFCRTVGTVTEDMIKEYIEKQEDNLDETFKIIK